MVVGEGRVADRDAGLVRLLRVKKNRAPNAGGAIVAEYAASKNSRGTRIEIERPSVPIPSVTIIVTTRVSGLVAVENTVIELRHSA